MAVLVRHVINLSLIMTRIAPLRLRPNVLGLDTAECTGLAMLKTDVFVGHHPTISVPDGSSTATSLNSGSWYTRTAYTWLRAAPLATFRFWDAVSRKFFSIPGCSDQKNPAR